MRSSRRARLVRDEPERREPPLVLGDVRASHPGSVACGGDARDRRPLPAIDDRDGAAEILVVTKLAPRGPDQLDRGEEPVPEAEGVDLDGLLAAGQHAPVAIDCGVDDAFDPPPSLGAHDDPPVAQPNTSPQKLRAVAERVAKERHVPGSSRGQPQDVRRPGCRPGLERADDVHAVVLELSGEGESERTTAGEEQPLAGRNPMHLRDRLRGAGSQHARKRPAREGDRAVVGAGGKQDTARRDRPRTLALGDEHRFGAAQRDAARPEQERRSGGLGCVDQRPSTPVIHAERAFVPHRQPGLLEDLPVDVGDRAAERGGLGGRREPGRAAPDHEQVVRLGVAHRRGRPGGGRFSTRARPLAAGHAGSFVGSA